MGRVFIRGIGNPRIKFDIVSYITLEFDDKRSHFPFFFFGDDTPHRLGFKLVMLMLNKQHKSIISIYNGKHSHNNVWITQINHTYIRNTYNINIPFVYITYMALSRCWYFKCKYTPLHGFNNMKIIHQCQNLFPYHNTTTNYARNLCYIYPKSLEMDLIQL